jgi:hypothetical protein
MLGPLARYLEDTQFARDAIEDRADLSPFKEKPSARLVIGLMILALSLILGWPVVAALGVAAVWVGDPYIVLIGGTAIYGFSWLLWAFSMYITGQESIKYGRIFLRWAVRRLVEKQQNS